MSAEHARNRSRSILLAVLTSFISKGGNILLILLAIPLAYQVLGEERAAIYGVMQSLMWLVSMSDLGTGPGMVRRLAGAVAAGDKAREASIVSTGFFISCGLVVTASGMLALLLACVPVTGLFGAAFAAHAGELHTAAWVSLAIFTVLMMLSALERVREGYQEVHIGNAYGSVYNIAAAAALWFGIYHWKSPVFVILAVYGVLIFFSLANTAGILWRRPWLRPSWKNIDLSMARSMAGEGIALFVAGSVAPILAREAPKFLLANTGRAHAAADVTHYWILVQLGLMGMGFALMLTRPLWPAMAEAAHRHDYSWVRAAQRRLIRWFLPAAAFTVAGFALLGPSFTHWWLKTGGGLTREHFTLYGLIFVLGAWTHFHYIIVGSLGKAHVAAWILGGETLLLLALTWTGIRWEGFTGALYGIAASMLLASAWMLPVALAKILRAHGTAAGLPGPGPQNEAAPVPAA